MKLLDLFCGAGGCSYGYMQAGFDIKAGVDLDNQPNYPFDFFQGDWLDGFNKFKNQVDVIHASPPCQAYSVCNNIFKNSKKPKLVSAVRKELIKWTEEKKNRFYIIENVPGSDLLNPIKVFGSGLGLNIVRERWFESNAALWGYPKRKLKEKSYYVFVGKQPGNPWFKDKEGATLEDWKRESGMHWAKTAHEISEAVPPAYTKYLGEQRLS